MTVGEVARHLGVSRSTVYQLCERGELRQLRVSNAIRVPIAAVASYVQRRAPGRDPDVGGPDPIPGRPGKVRR